MLMVGLSFLLLSLFFFNDTATTEIYTLSLHDALPICAARGLRALADLARAASWHEPPRSEEHTSELQSLTTLVCRLLLEKKKQKLSGKINIKKKTKKNKNNTKQIKK